MEEREKNAPIRSDILDAPESITSLDDRGDTTPVIKSLLKKPPSSNNLAHLRRKKTVSFNQTVIVFCEEIETSPPSNQYEPPLGYQDTSSDAFDPPKGYRDGRNEGKTDSKIGPQSTILDEVTNLADEKIFGLIDNESIIDAFNLNCDDLSEEDFPINYLSSSNGFLCNDAVSDYDTNSESSLSTERVVTAQSVIKPEPIPDSKHTKSRFEGQSEKSVSITSNVINKEKNVDEKQATSTPPSSSSSNTSRSLPARMKVTQLDANLVKRHPTRPLDSQDLNRNRDDRKHNEFISRVPSRAQEPVSRTHHPVGDKPTALANHSTNSHLSFNELPHPDSQIQTRPPAAPSLPDQSDRIDQKNSQSQPTCHICRVIESGKLPPSSKIEPRPDVKKIQELCSQEKPTNAQPVVFNQSCVSCRDAIIRQNLSRPLNVEVPQINRSLTYEIVHVLDRNGNRVRALSLVKQPFAEVTPREQSHDGNLSLTRPVKIQIPQAGAVSNSQSNWQFPSNVVIPQYRLVRASTVAPQSQEGIRRQDNGVNIRPQLVASMPLNRQPTIYYMQRPLETKGLGQSHEYHNHGLKAFPDPHEVRRLDGLRAPINQQANPIRTNAQGVPHNTEQFDSLGRVGDMQDETDDPTFGFSKRPSVKVVATSSLAPSLLANRKCDYNFTQDGNNLILQDSTQTLNRRPVHQNRTMRENLSCTTSLSNLNSILVGNPDGLPQPTGGPRANAITRDPIESKLTAAAATNSQLAGPKNAILSVRSNLGQQDHQNYPSANQILSKQGQNKSQQLRQSNNNGHNGQRKSAHNSGNIGNISSNISNRNRIPSISNVPKGSSPNSTNVQSIYPQQYTPPLPSNVIPTTPYHNNNINSHNSAATNNRLSHQRANEHCNERLRSFGNHMHSNNNINIVSTSSSVTPNIGLNLDQHHGSSMPLEMYNHHTSHMHHQVPPVMPTLKVDTKNNGNKNPGYHVHDASNNLLPSAQGGGQPSTSPGQMPQMAGDMSSAIAGMDMNAHPQGYAIQAFAPHHPHQMFSGPPIFQPYSYLIPYNIPPYVPYVPMPSNTVQPRPQLQPQTSQNSSSVATNNSHSRQTHSINQQLNNDHYDPSLTSNRNSNSQQFRLDSSQAADSNSTQGQILSERGNELKGNFKMVQGSSNGPVSSKLAAEDHNSFYSTNQEPHNQAVSLRESPNTELQNSKGIFTDKATPSSSKNKDASTTKGDEIDQGAPKSNPNTYACLANGDPTCGTTHLKDIKDTLLTSTSSTSDDYSAAKSTTEASSHTLSSPDASQAALESTEQLTKNITRKPQSVKVCNKLPTDQVSPDSHDPESTEAIQSSAGQCASSASKSWADLFKRQANHGTRSHGDEAENCTQWTDNSDEEGKTQKSIGKSELIAKSTTLPATKEQRSQDMAKRALDKMAHRIATRVNTINLKHALPFLKPRGFINKGNGCYINATLQALIACPPFYNLMKEIGDLRAFRRENSCTPILDSFAELFLHFPPLDSGKKVKHSVPTEPRVAISSLQAEAIEPKCIYNVLGNIKSECLRGAQEDAEEFLSSVLNGLHEEMISLGEVLHESNGRNNQQSDVDDLNDDNTNDDNLWREVGSKNRSLPIRIAKVVNTPIQEIFGGSLFSIRTAGKDRCGHRSPFFDLQLDISDDNVKSVQDAIKSFTSPEIIHDFYCSKTKQKLDAQRKTSLDQLPPILILHLKQFIYTQDCGLKKLMKKIEYPIDFELPESCLHEKNSADKNLLNSRSYKLLAVVYHDGKEAVKGHYLTDVYHIGSSQWIRCDDSNLKAISSPRIENPDTPRTPYLLFYRRLNTLRAQTNNHDNKKKN